MEMILACTKAQMDFISVGADKWYELTIRLNWMAIMLLTIAGFFIVWLVKKVFRKLTGKNVRIDGLTFGIRDFKCDLKVGYEIQEIAYNIWVELITRKIAVPLEEDDVIIEIYDSWYSAFNAIREQLKTVPGKCLGDAEKLIDITTRVLNEGLRPHLTKWQAKFRSWYENENSDENPQDLQKHYPEYDELMNDLKKTNKNMIIFADKLKEIAFTNKKKQKRFKQKNKDGEQHGGKS